MKDTKRVILTNALFINPVYPDSIDINHGHLIIEGELITEIVHEQTNLESYAPYEEINMENHVVMPGAVNLHAHLRPFRAFGDGLNLDDWHENIAEGLTKHVSDDDAYYGASLAFAEMLKNGVTTVLTFSTHFEAERQAALDTGIRAIMIPAANSREDLQPALNLLRHDSNNGRVTTWMGVELATRCSVELLQEVSRMAQEFNTGLHSHFSERKRQEINHLIAGNFLQNRHTILAHCIQVNDDDIQIFKKYNTCVAYNPKSNARLGNGVAPVNAFLKNNIRVGIGTDGPLSTFSLSFLEEMRVAVLLQRAYFRDAALLSSAHVLNMATLQAACGLGMHNLIGSIEKGKQADLVAIDFNKLHLTPHVPQKRIGNIAELIVHTVKQSDIALVLVAGKRVIADGKAVLIDEQELVNQVQRRSTNIIARL